MGFEDDYNPSGTITKVTRNVLGARGIDRISITENSATTHGYPLYDGHGNCRAILTRDGTDDYSTGNWRTYDVWGSVRSGSATGDPKSRYVASIGHVADDESSLIYMRARYYEPATGRFISEDPAGDGQNWYVYANNNPVLNVDTNGKLAGPLLYVAVMALVAIAAMLLAFWEPDSASAKTVKNVLAMVDSFIGAIDIVAIVVSLAPVTGPVGTGAALLATGVMFTMAIVAGVALAVALNQLRLLYLIETGDLIMGSGLRPSDLAGPLLPHYEF